METPGQINCPPPLPENTADALLTKMLTPAPYKVPEKTKKAKGTRKSSQRQVLSDSSSDNSVTYFSPDWRGSIFIFLLVFGGGVRRGVIER